MSKNVATCWNSSPFSGFHQSQPAHSPIPPCPAKSASLQPRTLRTLTAGVAFDALCRHRQPAVVGGGGGEDDDVMPASARPAADAPKTGAAEAIPGT